MEVWSIAALKLLRNSKKFYIEVNKLILLFNVALWFDSVVFIWLQQQSAKCLFIDIHFYTLFLQFHFLIMTFFIKLALIN